MNKMEEEIIDALYGYNGWEDTDHEVFIGADNDRVYRERKRRIELNKLLGVNMPLD